MQQLLTNHKNIIHNIGYKQ